jgi:hypothetical protein
VLIFNRQKIFHFSPFSQSLEWFLLKENRSVAWEMRKTEWIFRKGRPVYQRKIKISLGGVIMRVILRIYEHIKTMEREFSDAEEVRRLVSELVKDNPHIFVQPCLEIDAGRMMNLSDSESDDESVGLPFWGEVVQT